MSYLFLLSSIAAAISASSQCVDSVPPPSPALADCGDFSLSPSLVVTDGCGRARFFRGLNKVNKSPPYIPSSTVFEAGNSLAPTDLALWQSVGWNLVRLGVLWSGTVPQEGIVNASYLSDATTLVSALKAAGISTLVDFHQDLFSAAFCADGAPVWAAQKYSKNAAPFPMPLAPPYPIDNSTGVPSAGCGNFSWSEYYFSDAAASAFQTFYNSPIALADVMQHWEAVAAAFAPLTTGVLFYELLNEPWVGDQDADPLLLLPGVADRVNLQPFYWNVSLRLTQAHAAAAAAAAVAAGAPASGTPYSPLIMYETVTFDDFFPAGFDSLPFADTNSSRAILSFHYYVLPNFDAATQVATRVADAKRLNAAPVLTEFDVAIIDPWEPISVASVEELLALCDAQGISWTGWEYADLWNHTSGDFALVTATVLSYPFPMAVAGIDVSYAYNANETHFSLNYSAVAVLQDLPTVVFVSTALTYPGAAFTIEANVPYQIAWHNSSSTTATGACSALDPQPLSFAYILLQSSGVEAGTRVSLTISPSV